MIFYTDFHVPKLNRTFWIAKNDKGICYIELNGSEKRFIEILKKNFNDEVSRSKSKLSLEVKQILEYFKGKRRNFALRVFLKGSGFQTQTWVALSKVGYGKTVSYSELAALAGNKKAFRAAATSCAKNPVPIIIPCHRVIAKDGSIGGFGGGIEMKKKMLHLEKAAGF